MQFSYVTTGAGTPVTCAGVDTGVLPILVDEPDEQWLRQLEFYDAVTTADFDACDAALEDGLPDGWLDDDLESLLLTNRCEPGTESDAVTEPASTPLPAASAVPVGVHPLDFVYEELDALTTAFAEVERERARLEARRARILAAGAAWAARHANDVVASSESPARRRELAHRSMIAEFATATRMSERTLSTQVDRAMALVTHTRVISALGAGEISAGHAAVIVDEIDSLVETEGEKPDPALVDDFEFRLLERAARKAPGEVRRTARRWRENTLPESIAVRHERARERREFWIEPLEDAMSCLHLLLPSDAAARIHAGFTSEAIHARSRDGEARTMDQLRADLVIERLLAPGLTKSGAFGVAGSGAASEAGAIAVADAVDTDDGRNAEWPAILPSLRVLVTVPVFTLAGISDEPAMLDGYGPIPPEMARRLVAHAPSLTRILTHPVSGAVLDVDRTVYKVPTSLRTWLMIRDGTCRFPGCTRRAISADTDHTIAWEDGGSTSVDNLGHLCRKHHGLKHAADWSVMQSVTRDERGYAQTVMHWTSPTGRRYSTHDDGPQ